MLLLFYAEQESMSPKPRRSLNFTTPKTKAGKDPYTPGSFTPLKSPLEPLNGSLLGRGVSSQKKRQRDSPSGRKSDSEIEYDEEDLKTTGRCLHCKSYILSWLPFYIIICFPFWCIIMIMLHDHDDASEGETCNT